MANRHFREKSAEEAWNRVNEIFPTDYAKDEDSSQRAGYPIFRSTADGHFYDYICDLNDRLEVNLSTGETVNIWIEQETEPEVAPEKMEASIRILSRNGFLEDSPHIVQIRTSRHTPTSRTKTVRSTHSVGPENTRDTVSQEICH